MTNKLEYPAHTYSKSWTSKTLYGKESPDLDYIHSYLLLEWNREAATRAYRLLKDKTFDGIPWIQTVKGWEEWLSIYYDRPIKIGHIIGKVGFRGEPIWEFGFRFKNPIRRRNPEICEDCGKSIKYCECEGSISQESPNEFVNITKTDRMEYPHYSNQRFYIPRTIYGKKEPDLTYEYADRLRSYNIEAAKIATEGMRNVKDWSRTAQGWENWLSLYYNRQVDLRYIQAGINSTDAYPFYVLGYKFKNPRKAIRKTTKRRTNDKKKKSKSR